MTRDPLWREIKSSLSRRVDPALFERCAQELLHAVYPDLTPVVGGSDAGMDGSKASADGVYPLICTTGHDALSNVRNSLTNYLREHNGPKRCVIATTTFLTPQRRRNVIKAAGLLGVTVVNIHDGEDFVGRLYTNAKWRVDLLGVTGTPPALSALPPDPRRVSSPVVIGRDEDLAWLCSTAGDLLLVGQPGAGKTYLHHHWATHAAVLFAVDDAPGRCHSRASS